MNGKAWRSLIEDDKQRSMKAGRSISHKRASTPCPCPAPPYPSPGAPPSPSRRTDGRRLLTRLITWPTSCGVMPHGAPCCVQHRSENRVNPRFYVCSVGIAGSSRRHLGAPVLLGTMQKGSSCFSKVTLVIHEHCRVGCPRGVVEKQINKRNPARILRQVGGMHRIK